MLQAHDSKRSEADMIAFVNKGEVEPPQFDISSYQHSYSDRWVGLQHSIDVFAPPHRCIPSRAGSNLSLALLPLSAKAAADKPRERTNMHLRTLLHVHPWPENRRVFELLLRNELLGAKTSTPSGTQTRVWAFIRLLHVLRRGQLLAIFGDKGTSKHRHHV